MTSVVSLCSLQEFRTQETIDHSLTSDYEACLDAVTFIKNAVIGSNKQKQTVLDMGFLTHLVRILQERQYWGDSELALEASATVASIAKGSEDHIEQLVLADCLSAFIAIITDPLSGEKIVQTSLRALQAIYCSSQTDVSSLFETQEQTSNSVSRLLQLASPQQPLSNQENVAAVMAKACQLPVNQRLLRDSGAIQVISNLITSPCSKVQLAALCWLSQLCHQNEIVSTDIVTPTAGRQPIPETLTHLMSQEKPLSMQLNAAKCMTYLYRANAICPEDKRIVYKTLPTLIRICKKENDPLLRIQAAEILAYLTEVESYLQQTASTCDQIIPTLASMLKFQAHATVPTSVNFSSQGYGHMNPLAVKKLQTDVKVAMDMKRAAFKAFASFAANDEDIRRKILETDMLMEHIVNGLSDPNDEVKLAALQCLRSLSRSVQLLETTFQEHAVWIPLRNLLDNAPDDILTVASSTLCNLLSEFSKSKQHFADRSAMEMLCALTKRSDPALRFNGIYALMNMAYHADKQIKMQILSVLGTEQIYRLLSDPDATVVMKTLGLLRNLLAHKSHIDHIMTLHGRELMDVLIVILDGSEQPADIKEQTLCIFASIANGESAREFIMQRDDILKRLIDFMLDENAKLQTAAVYCITCLIWSEEDDAQDRQHRLKEFGVHKLLQQLLGTTDTNLFDKVKTALQQFNN
ncbi:Armadillo repeat-containing protein 8 [Halotydeus destructor]|nr:Armadillo repeat-containing protein 8 [Halotydeus destructor]